MAIPPRPQFFSPHTPEEQAILAAWDAMYGDQQTTPTPTPTPTPVPTPNPVPVPTGGGTSLQPMPQQTGQPAGSPWENFNSSGNTNYLLPGYGMSQNLQKFGIPGFEQNPMIGGGSWAGTQWNPAPYSGLQEAVIPDSDVTNPKSPFYRGPVTAPDGSPLGEGLKIQPAVPYQTTWNLQTYSGKQPPYLNVHEQIGESMKGIPSAYPGFAWASPTALNALGGYGLPGGWTSMLGFTPGGTK